MVRQRRISQLIPFTRDADGDYHGEAGGVHFRIHKSTDAGFGLTAYRIADNIALHREGMGGIAWHRTVKKCVYRAERILEQETSASGAR